MDHLFEGLARSIGMSAVAAAVLGFILAAVIDGLRDAEDTSTKVWCVAGLAAIGGLVGLYLHGKAVTCPEPPAYGDLDLRETVCHLVKPRSDVPTFPSSG